MARLAQEVEAIIDPVLTRRLLGRSALTLVSAIVLAGAVVGVESLLPKPETGALLVAPPDPETVTHGGTSGQGVIVAIPAARNEAGVAGRSGADVSPLHDGGSAENVAGVASPASAVLAADASGGTGSAFIGSPDSAIADVSGGLAAGGASYDGGGEASGRLTAFGGTSARPDFSNGGGGSNYLGSLADNQIADISAGGATPSQTADGSGGADSGTGGPSASGGTPGQTAGGSGGTDSGSGGSSGNDTTPDQTANGTGGANSGTGGTGGPSGNDATPNQTADGSGGADSGTGGPSASGGTPSQTAGGSGPEDGGTSDTIIVADLPGRTLGGVGPIDSDVVVGEDATVSPGFSPGNLVVCCDYTLAGGSHIVDIGGTVFDELVREYDRVTAGGNIYLDGTITISLIDLDPGDDTDDPYVPQLGDLFDIFIGGAIFTDNSASYGSAFFPTAFVFPDFGNGLYFETILGTNSAGREVLSLLVSDGEPVVLAGYMSGGDYIEMSEPGGLAIFAFGLLGLVAAARMRPASRRLPVSP